MINSRFVLRAMIALSIGVPILWFPSQGFADTLAQTWGLTGGGGCIPDMSAEVWVSPALGPCFSLATDSDPNTAKTRTFDIGNGDFTETTGNADASAAYGTNQADTGVDTSSTFNLSISPNIELSYSLEVLSSTGWVDIIQTSLSDSGPNISESINQGLTGQFDFTSGVTYQVRSILSIADVGEGADAYSQSLWTDAFMFSGNPGGDVTADFNVSLIASLNSILTNTPGVRHPYDSEGDATASAVLDDIDVTQGAQLHSGAEGVYPVPEPSTLLLLAIGLGSAQLIDIKRYKKLLLTTRK